MIFGAEVGDEFPAETSRAPEDMGVGNRSVSTSPSCVGCSWTKITMALNLCLLGGAVLTILYHRLETSI